MESVNVLNQWFWDMIKCAQIVGFQDVKPVLKIPKMFVQNVWIVITLSYKMDHVPVKIYTKDQTLTDNVLIVLWRAVQ